MVRQTNTGTYAFVQPMTFVLCLEADTVSAVLFNEEDPPFILLVINKKDSSSPTGYKKI